jgi:hypothetical protein
MSRTSRTVLAVMSLSMAAVCPSFADDQVVPTWYGMRSGDPKAVRLRIFR